jgi:GT2 family glycosyltransferase
VIREAPSPSVAAIVVTRDRPALLADALRSIALQRPAPVEVRIANDGAEPVDGAVEALPVLEVTVLPVDVGQAGAARNRAAAGARADVLAFLDDDDLWLPGHLEGLLLAFGDPAVEVAYRDAAVVRERLDGESRIALGRRTIARDWNPETMARDDYVPPSALAIRRSRFEALGGFDESFTLSEDWELLLRAARRTTPRRVPGITVEVRMRDSGHLSQERGRERRACLDRLAARHGLAPLTIKTFWEVAADVGVGAAEGEEAP